MKNISRSILLVAVAMMCSVSFNNAAAEGPNHGRGPGYGNVEHRGDKGRGHHDRYSDPVYSHAPAARHNGPAVHHGGPAIHHAPAPRPRPVVKYRPAPRPRPVAVYHNNAGRRIRRAIATAAAIEATRAIVGSLVYNLPPYCREILIDGAIFYVADNILYRPIVVNGAPCFEVVNPEYYY